MRLSHLIFSALLGLTAPLLPSAYAQDETKDGTYYYWNDATIDGDVRGRTIVVGKDSQGANYGTQELDRSALTLASGAIADTILVYNKNTLNIEGGIVTGVDAEDDSTVNVSGGWTQFFSVSGAGATVNVSGGTVHSLASYAGVVNFTDGKIDQFAASAGIVNWYGGAITDGILNLDYKAVINLHGDDLHFSSSEADVDGRYTDYFLNGTLRNGTVLSGLRVRDWNGGTSVTNFDNPDAQDSSVQFVRSAVAVNAPEPGTLALVFVTAPGLVAVARRRRKGTRQG